MRLARNTPKLSSIESDLSQCAIGSDGTVHLCPSTYDVDVFVVGRGEAGRAAILSVIGAYLREFYLPVLQGIRSCESLPALRIGTADEKPRGQEGIALQVPDDWRIREACTLNVMQVKGALTGVLPPHFRRFLPESSARFKSHDAISFREELQRDHELTYEEVMRFLGEKKIPITIVHDTTRVETIRKEEGNLRVHTNALFDIDIVGLHDQRLPCTFNRTADHFSPDVVLAAGVRPDRSFDELRQNTLFCDGVWGLPELMEEVSPWKPARGLIRGAGAGYWDVMRALYKFECQWDLTVVAPRMPALSGAAVVKGKEVDYSKIQHLQECLESGCIDIQLLIDAFERDIGPKFTTDPYEHCRSALAYLFEFTKGAPDRHPPYRVLNQWIKFRFDPLDMSKDAISYFYFVREGRLQFEIDTLEAHQIRVPEGQCGFEVKFFNCKKPHVEHFDFIIDCARFSGKDTRDQISFLSKIGFIGEDVVVDGPLTADQTSVDAFYPLVHGCGSVYYANALLDQIQNDAKQIGDRIISRFKERRGLN